MPATKEYLGKWREQHPDYMRDYYRRNKERRLQQMLKAHGGPEGLREYQRRMQRESRARRREAN